MELKEFFKLLLKYKYILITVPMVAVIVTYFLVKHLPDEYESHGQIATGIVDQTKQMLDPITSTIQETMVSGKFSNLIEVMKMKKMRDMVSYKLLIHDLTDPKPFRKFPKYYEHWGPKDTEKALPVLRAKMERLEPLYLTPGGNTYEDWLNGLIVGKHFDERSLDKAFTISRAEDSDFITVLASSDNPILSAFMVNALIKGFIDYQTSLVKGNEAGALTYLTKLLEQKRQALVNKTDSLQLYKVQNGILNLEDQAKTTAEQIAGNDEKLLQVQKDEDSYRGAIDNIDQKFEPGQRKYIESRVTRYNSAVTASQARQRALIDKYTNSNFDPKIKASIDSLQAKITEQLNQTSDQYNNNPLVGKEDLVKQKNTLEVSYDLARYSREAIEAQQKKLRKRFDKLVPLDARVKAYNFEIENASKEYQETLTKFNLTNLQSQSNSSSKLLQVEVAVPELAQPSKKMLLVILSGVATGIFCVIILFVIFFLDDGIKNPNQLANATSLPVLGYLNLVSGTSLDLRKLWDIEHRDKMQEFKDLLRAIRFEIDQELDGEKVLAITSMKEGEGKTLLAISLAYSYSMINKKVLLIDGNFENPTISTTVNPKLYVEDLFKNVPGGFEPVTNTNSVAGNRGGDITLLEISDERFIRQKINELKTVYDLILIDTPPIDSMNKAKEWLLFSNKFVAVFEADQTIANGKKQMVKYLQDMPEQFAGWVLNKTLYNAKRKRKR
jgi:succinoglycan biosynthesis transport protein ExoP